MLLTVLFTGTAFAAGGFFFEEKKPVRPDITLDEAVGRFNALESLEVGINDLWQNAKGNYSTINLEPYLRKITPEIKKVIELCDNAEHSLAEASGKKVDEDLLFGKRAQIIIASMQRYQKIETDMPEDPSEGGAFWVGDEEMGLYSEERRKVRQSRVDKRELLANIRAFFSNFVEDAKKKWTGLKTRE